MEEIQIKRDDLGMSRRMSQTLSTAQTGEIRVKVKQIGLSSNNVSYASAGDFLGYWAHFSHDPEWGIVPVWGFAEVTESHCPEIRVGERIFGFLPMAADAIFKPASINDICFSDSSDQRAALHPWYRRLYRCQNDPAFNESLLDAQPLLWALFMTGWMMADELQGNVDTVYVSSASSKTAISLGWALKALGIEAVGITSRSNQAFADGLDLYTRTITYDDLSELNAADRSAYVDIAGNAKVTSDIHVALGDKLKDSVMIGSTHRSPSQEPLPMPGPSPRFFFIPDVAEKQAEAMGFDAYHQTFASAWQGFAEWSVEWLEFEHASGSEAIEKGYLKNVNENISPRTAMLFNWS